MAVKEKTTKRAEHANTKEALINGHPGHEPHGFRKCDFRKPSFQVASATENDGTSLRRGKRE
jgi:hypothetical protein